jgi:hypothetical protein
MEYPNRLIKKGEADTNIVKAVQQQLNVNRCGPIDVDGVFADATVSAVKLFQTRHTDANGASLKADGQIGSLTWAALFGEDSVAVTNVASSSLLNKVIEIAQSQIGIVENPIGSNRGPEVDIFLRTVGLDPVGEHYSWCAAFVYWCFNQAAAQLNLHNPLIKTAGVIDHWNRATCAKISKAAAIANPGLIQPGHIFIIDHGNGSGHTGLVESTNGGNLVTIEGNTNEALSSNGYGVFRLTRRKVTDITKGFLNYA